MGTIKEQQLDIMLTLCVVCGVLSLFSAMIMSLSRKRRVILVLIEFEAMILLMSDRFAYIYRGESGSTAHTMVRVSNFLVYVLYPVILATFNEYMCDLCINEAGLEKVPKRLSLVKLLAPAGALLIVINLFTGYLYTFDSSNTYHRAGGFFVSYIVPIVILVIQLSAIIHYFGNLRITMRISMLIFTLALPAAAIVQAFTYGISIVNIAIALVTIVLFIFVLTDLNLMIQTAHEREIEHLKQEQNTMRKILGQTAYALADAVEAKDEYTSGHSARVAEYSEMIAREAGKSVRECKEIYFIALLHDVGKIGVPGDIINKTSRLDDDEYATIKTHTVQGNRILSKITSFPKLSIGAHYHHERYDGKGYPEGIGGEDIPEIARIIAVADAYDAMSSKRSYRDVLPQEVVRSEIEKGLGTQFDPEFGRIMLRLIDSDKEYRMREC